MFARIHTQWAWRPIPTCPGRFILVDDDDRRPIHVLVPGAYEVQTFHVSGIRDRIAIVAFAQGDGGLISYLRPDGTILHTLNTADGFDRKLRQLGIHEHFLT